MVISDLIKVTTTKLKPITMHARKVSHKILFNTLPWIHAARINALHECLLAAIESHRLSVTGIGRFINSDAKEKHCIKRADRLLFNHHLWAERIMSGKARYYQANTEKKRRVLSALFLVLRVSGDFRVTISDSLLASVYNKLF